ncbi:MAG: YicC/YloC family endoribonuclease [Hyphomonas sp.]|uniref:YicC/YloC family endoribonuclease n=1 Tax=Hyphomonas sp. TaxID=87 RepID=UPI0035294691
MSNLSGMTGFARVSGEAEWGSWAWEAKSVNGRGLDVRVAYPPGFDAVERAIKTAAPRFFQRGSLQVSLRIDLADSGDQATINQALLDSLVATVEKRLGMELSGEALASLVAVKGVVEAGGSSLRDLGADEGVVAMLAKAGEQALAALQAERLKEGDVLKALLAGLVTDMESHRAQAEALAAAQPKLVHERLTKQLAELDTDGRVDRERLAAEVALSAAKADVREELDRLSAHFDTAHGLLAAGSPVGRKLDFLAQELNREANTLCSKSASLDLTNAGLGLKGLIDQFKEQAANVE